MASYKIEWKRSAIKELKKLHPTNIYRIIEAVENLANHPYPDGSKKLRASEYTYRIRIGNYRVIYAVFSDKLVIEIIKVGHRKETYRKF